MHIAIIGAGLSGPLLAQGLIRQGAEVTLIEGRTPAEHRNSGYRIHLDPQGDLALRACLEPSAYELVLRTAGVEGSGWRVLDSRLDIIQEMLVEQPGNPLQGRHLTVDRQTLREILLDGLGDSVRYGAAFQAYDLVGERVRVRLANSDLNRGDPNHRDLNHGDPAEGEVVQADLLVGADGSGSRVRAQRLPRLQVLDVGLINIFGRTLLSPDVLRDVPRAAFEGFCAVVCPEGQTMPLAVHRFAHPTQASADELRPGLRLSNSRDYLMWVLSLPAGMLPEGGVPKDLVTFVADHVQSWQPQLARLVRASAPGSVHATTVRTSRRPEPWDPGLVTLIGDAVHPMIPAGIGAAVALADAARLAQELGPVIRGETPLPMAVGQYEQAMRQYGFDAVEASEQRLQS